MSEAIGLRVPKPQAEGSNPSGVTEAAFDAALAVSACPEAAERWLPVPGFQVYEVSSAGRVRRSSTGRVLSASPLNRKTRGRRIKRLHLRVGLSVDGVVQTKTVHSLVAAAFLGPRPAGHEIDHVNDDGTDNRVENLRYVTPAVNIAKRDERMRVMRGQLQAANDAAVLDSIWGWR